MKNHLKLTLWMLMALSGQGFGATTLVLWEHEKTEEQVVLDKLIQEFEKENKDIKVKRAHYKTEDLRAQFQTAAMSGGGGDVVIAPNDFAGPFSIMGIIKPVNDFVQAKRFFPSVVTAVTDAKGQIWGFPVSNGNHLMLFVNQKFVPKAPQTLEELIKVAKAVTKPKDQVYGLAYNLSEPFWFITFFSAYGEKPLVNGAPKLKNDAMVKALSLVSDMKFKDKIVPGDCDYTCADTLFTEQKAAMVINGDWAIQKYDEALKGNLIVAPLPKLTATGKFMQPMVSGKYIFFNRRLSGSKLAAGQKFAEFMVKTSSQELVAKEIGRLPASIEAAKSATVSKDPMLSASLGAMENGQAMPMDVEMRAVWDAIRPQLQNVLAGRTKPELAADLMQKDAETKISEMKR